MNPLIEELDDRNFTPESLAEYFKKHELYGSDQYRLRFSSSEEDKYGKRDVVVLQRDQPGTVYLRISYRKPHATIEGWVELDISNLFPDDYEDATELLNMMLSRPGYGLWKRTDKLVCKPHLIPPRKWPYCFEVHNPTSERMEQASKTALEIYDFIRQKKN